MFSAEIDQLLSELSASLAPSQRSAFDAAARAALADIRCLGPGTAYRILAGLQKFYFDPPLDTRVAHAGPRPFRGGKLTAAAPIGAPDPREGARARRRFRVVG
jgi:hypothetical protein